MKYTEDQIDAYIRGEMTRSDKVAFEKDMKQDAALAREVEMMRMIVGGLKDRQEKLEKMTQWQREIEKRRTPRVTTLYSVLFRNWLPWVTAFSAAAAVVLGVFLFRPVLTPSPTPTFTSPGMVMRGGDFSELDSLIEQGNYRQAQEAVQAEITKTRIMLQESVRKREEAEYEIQKYEYTLNLLQQKMIEIEEKRGSE